MFQKAAPLDRIKHKDLKFSPKAGYEFAREMPVSILGHSEFVPASKLFPIVFSPAGDGQQSALPQAVLSIENGKNAFVAEDGSWKANYVPKHILRYPFILGRLPKDNQFAVMIDEAAPQFAGENGSALFTESGESTQLVANAAKFLEDYQKEIVQTLQFVKEIEKHELLKPMNIKITQGNADRQVKGFRVLDFKKLLTLDDQILAQWVRNGMMVMLYAHLFSLQNFAHLAKLQGIELSAPVSEPS